MGREARGQALPVGTLLSYIPGCPCRNHRPRGIGMLRPFIPGDALGNLFLQATSSGLRLQLGPSPVVIHMAVFRGTPARDPGRGSDAAQRCRQGAGRRQEAAGTTADQEAAEGRKERKALCEAAPGCCGDTAPQPLRGVLGRAGCSPLPQHCGREGGLVPSVPKAGGCEGPLPIPPHVHLHPTATYLTETENSPGELSLSRIRKAPRCLRLRSCSSARCREILPAYHLRGASGSAAQAPLDTRGHPSVTSPPHRTEAPRALMPAGAGSPLGSLQGWDPPAVFSPFLSHHAPPSPPPPPIYHSTFAEGGTTGHCGCRRVPVQHHRQPRPHPVTRLVTSRVSSPTVLPVPPLPTMSHGPPWKQPHQVLRGGWQGRKPSVPG